MRYLNSTKLLSVFLFIVLVVSNSGHQAVAQSTSISPYSRFGLGDIHDLSFAEQSGMGGFNVVNVDAYAINPGNPAAHAFITRPTFAMGARVQLLNLSTTSVSQSSQNNTINNIAVAFPMMKNKMGLAVGLMPFSSIGYDIAQEYYNEEIDQQIRLEYLGDGGINQTFVGTAYKLIDKTDSIGNNTVLSAGINVAILFGDLIEKRKSIFPTGYEGFNFRVEDSYRLTDVSFDLGLNYGINLKKLEKGSSNYTRLILGGTFRIPKNMSVRGSELAETFTVNNTTNIEVPRDTVNYTPYGSGRVFLPAAFQIGGGIDLVNKKFRKLFVGLEYRTENWANYSNSFSEENVFNTLPNSHRFVVGTSFLPTIKSSRKILQKMHYRMGLRYELTNIKLRDEQISAYGISFGLGVPIGLKRQQSPSTFNIGVEMRQRGTTANNLLKEDIINISLGLTLMPNYRQPWFVKKKYD
jgi:hypothetical protein